MPTLVQEAIGGHRFTGPPLAVGLQVAASPAAISDRTVAADAVLESHVAIECKHPPSTSMLFQVSPCVSWFFLYQNPISRYF